MKWRHISAGTAVEAETEGAAIPLSSQNTKSYNFLLYDYLQTVHELCSSLSWTVHTLLSVSPVLLTESRGHVYPFIQVGQGSLILWRAVCLWSLHICYCQCLNVGFLMNFFWNWTYIYYLVHWDLLENQEMTNCSVHIKQNQLFRCS